MGVDWAKYYCLLYGLRDETCACSDGGSIYDRTHSISEMDELDNTFFHLDIIFSWADDVARGESHRWVVCLLWPNIIVCILWARLMILHGYEEETALR
jgi:hypothetical protein